MNQRWVAYTGAKTVTLWDETGTKGWEPIGGGAKIEEGTASFLAQYVAFMFRANEIRANAIASIPWALVSLKGSTEFDLTEDWQNKLGLMPDPEKAIWKIASAQGLGGCAYYLKRKNAYDRDRLLQWLAPSTVSYEMKDDKMIFTRRMPDGKDVPYQPAVDQYDKANNAKDTMLYLWYPDEAVEFQPPSKWPGLAAIKSSGVIFSMDDVMNAYFKNGMVKVTAFAVPANTPPEEKEKFENQIQRFARGMKNAWNVLFLRADKVEPVVIGEGLAETSGNHLNQEKREDIAVAFGIPMSHLLSSTISGLGGGGVSKDDDRRLIQNTALPAWKGIARELNRQLWEPLGYRMVSRHETMDIFQEDERERSYAVLNYVNAYVTDPNMARAMVETLGVEIPPEAEKFITLFEKEREENKRKMEEQTQQQEKEQPRFSPAREEQKSACDEDLEKWQRKALKRIGKACRFESEVIPPDVHTTITEKLPDCLNEQEVKALFMEYFGTHTEPVVKYERPDFTPLLTRLDEAVRMYQTTSEPQPLNVSVYNYPQDPVSVNVNGFKYDPNQPRVPAGNTTGGQWTDENVSAGDSYYEIGTARGKPVYEIRNATALVDDGEIAQVVVGVRGGYKGKIIGSPDMYVPHSEMISALNNGGTVDDYVRFSIHDGNLSARTYFSGVEVNASEDWEIEAIDNIYYATERMVEIGLPPKTPLKIYKYADDIFSVEPIVTTAKTRAVNINVSPPDIKVDVETPEIAELNMIQEHIALREKNVEVRDESTPD